jgi:hypothetical protein
MLIIVLPDSNTNNLTDPNVEIEVVLWIQFLIKDLV